jgi:hypothetical protein
MKMQTLLRNKYEALSGTVHVNQVDSENRVSAYPYNKTYSLPFVGQQLDKISVLVI